MDKVIVVYIGTVAVASALLLWSLSLLADDDRYDPLYRFTAGIIAVYLTLFLLALRGHQRGASVVFFFAATTLIVGHSLVFSADAQMHLLLLGMLLTALVLLAPHQTVARWVVATATVVAYLVVELALPKGTGLAPLDPDILPKIQALVRLSVVAHVTAAVAAMQYRFRTSRRTLQGVAAFGQLSADTDALTGLFNRRPVVRRLEDLAARGAGGYAIAVIDVDRFKSINDGLGHDCGDRIIKRVADLLSECFRDRDIVSRWGGDEFLVLIDLRSGDEVFHVLDRVRMRVNEQVRDCDGREHQVTVSVGAAVGGSRQTPDEVIALADEALYEAKKAGRDRVVVLGDGREPASAAARAGG